MRVGLRLACVFCALYLGACSLLAPSNAPFLKEPLKIAPATLGEHTVEQRLIMRWPGGGRAMDAVLEISANRLQLVALAFGMRMASLDYDGKTLTEQRFVPHAPEGSRILNDLLMIAAPLEVLQDALPPGVSATQTRQDGKLRREIVRDGTPFIVIDFESESLWQGKVHFRNSAGGYELVLESHEI